MLKTLFQCYIYIFVKKLKLKNIKKDGCFKLKITFKIINKDVDKQVYKLTAWIRSQYHQRRNNMSDNV